MSNLGIVDVNIAGSGERVGGLVGENDGSIATSYSTGKITGLELVGGLVGVNYPGSVTQCYSTSVVIGTGQYSNVGGLVGYNDSRITSSYSTGKVSGSEQVGGLVGNNDPWGTEVTACFWDTQTSGQTWSVEGTGKTTAEMQTAATFLEVGWDFVDETENGIEDIWWILEGKDYPRLWWENAEP